MSHWAGDYIGIPWESGAQGPDAYDCWAFVRRVQHDHYGRDLPAVEVNAFDVRAVIRLFESHSQRWEKVEFPQDGDCMLLSQATRPTHVGVWVDADGGGLLHSMDGVGVIFTNKANLEKIGYNILGCFRYKDIH